MQCRNHPNVIEGVRQCMRCGGPFCRDCLVEVGGASYCATCKAETILDVRSGVDRRTLPLASVWKRWGAIIIDGLIIGGPIYLVFFAWIFYNAFKGVEPPWWTNLLGIPVNLLNLVYEGLMFQYKDGQTLGKMALRIRVVRPDGTSITTGQAWGRAGLKVLFGCLIIFDYVPAFFTEERTTLHDMAANTRVVEIS